MNTRAPSVPALFADHLQLLLEFHMDDAAVGEGQFQDPVTETETAPHDPQSLWVTLSSGQRLRITVEIG